MIGQLKFLSQGFDLRKVELQQWQITPFPVTWDGGTFQTALSSGGILNSLTQWPCPPSVNVVNASYGNVWLGLSISYLRFDIICKPWPHSPVNMAGDQWKKSTKWRKVNIIYFCLLVFSLDSNKFDIAFLPHFIL